MRKRYVFGFGLFVLAILLTLVVWQGSFSFGEYGPSNPAQAIAVWAISTLIFLLTVTVGFMLFKTGVKLYLERRSNQEGSRIKMKLVLGALALSLLPVVFQVLFSYEVLNRNVEKWFMIPIEGIRLNLRDTAVSLGDEVQGRAQALVSWLAALPEVRDQTADFSKLCRENRIAELRWEDSSGASHSLCSDAEAGGQLFTARAKLGDSENNAGTLVIRIHPRVDLAEKQGVIDQFFKDYDQLS